MTQLISHTAIIPGTSRGVGYQEHGGIAKLFDLVKGVPTSCARHISASETEFVPAHKPVVVARVFLDVKHKAFQ